MSDTARWREQIERQRERKDEYFRDNPHSPIPDHVDFHGLSYFEPDPSLRFELPLEEPDEKETLTVATTTEGERTYHRWGAFTVEVDGEPATLQAYKADPDDERLWVPFRDETNGEETYGGGRYLDLEESEHLVDGTWVLDFNLAYNPTCVYSDRYECPMVPMENWLDVPIEAGEKLPDWKATDDGHAHGDHGHVHDHSHDHDHDHGHDHD